MSAVISFFGSTGRAPFISTRCEMQRHSTSLCASRPRGRLPGESWGRLGRSALCQRFDELAEAGEAAILGLRAEIADVDLLHDDQELEDAEGVVPAPPGHVQTGAHLVERGRLLAGGEPGFPGRHRRLAAPEDAVGG